MNFESNFAKVIQQLNEAQWEAVRQIEGPMLAIAGPGTGKTHMLTARIGQILLQTDSQPHNILCLTFTDAGAHAMRQRLTDFVGAEAHKVHIFTFHAFCNKVIQENIALFGRTHLQALSELERIDIVRFMLYNLPPEHVLKAQKDAYHYEKHLQHLFKTMKAERWTFQQISDAIDDYLALLPSNPDFIYKKAQGTSKQGDIKLLKINEVAQKMERLRAAAALFEQYQNELSFRRRYDYEDMILWTLDGFENYEYLLRRYQEQYNYVLVDEFQDTNGAQNRLLEKLMQYWGDDANIFAVGDDDQAIYEFQGARIKNMLDFFDRYRTKITVVQLQENYRSSQHILDSAKNVIDNNKIRLVTELQSLSSGKKLWAVNADVAHNPLKISLIAYPNRLQEEIAIIDKIIELRQQGCALKDIAIIYARHRQVRNIVHLLEQNKIPYKTKRRINILEQPLIQNLRQILRYFAHEISSITQNDELLFEILHYPFFGLAVVDILKLSRLQAHSGRGWYELLNDKNYLQTIDLQDIQAVFNFTHFINSALSQLAILSLPEWIELVYNKSGLLDYVANDSDKFWFLQLLHSFFEFVNEETAKNLDWKLANLLDTWQKMEDNRVEVGLFKTVFAENGVNLITAHSAKGLEFKHVFIINCLKEFWEDAPATAHQQFSFPDTLNPSNESDAAEARRRLFYVALTRARVGLYLSYYLYKNDEKPAQRSQFVDELLASGQIELQQQQIEEKNLYQAQFNLLRSVPLPVDLRLNTEALNELLADFTMSASALTAYILCPLSFYYEYILKIPHTNSAESRYGIAAHDSLKKLFDTAAQDKTAQIPDAPQFLTWFEEHLNRQKLNKTNFSFYKNLGFTQLVDYYNQRIAQWQNEILHKTVITERNFKNTTIDDIPVTGAVDKMVLHKENGEFFWSITDYKTGKLLPERLSAPTPAQPQGGTYWRQLIFYKLLIEQSNSSPYFVRKAEIEYLSPNSQGAFIKKEIPITQTDTQQFRAILKENYQKILNHEFSEGCNRPTCKWCNFVKRISIADRFNNEELEELV